jgi:hypothetical protein
VGTVCIGLGLSCCHLRLAPDATTPEAGILVAVSPAVDCALDKTALAPQAGVQLCQCPSDGVAFSLVVQTVALVRVLRAARAGVNAVLSLEIRRKLIDVDRLHVASNCVLHLDAVAGVLKGDPLNTILVLSNNERSCSRNGTRCSVGIDTRTARRSLVHVRCAHWRSLRLLLRWAET